MAPVRSYTNWNSRITDEEEQIEPYRKYFFICEGANTETWYFKKLIDIRKELNIHPLIDIRLLEKTEGDRDISFPRRLIEFAENQKENPEIAFDKERDKMIVVFDGDIFEEKVLDYDELVAEGEKNNILAVSNPAFELFLLLHYENSYEDDIEPKVFAEGVAKDIRNFLPAKYENAEFQVMQMNKNNGVQMVGVQVRLQEENVCPVVYVEPFFNEIRLGEPVEKVMNEIARCMEEAGNVPFLHSGINPMDYDSVKEHLAVMLVNTPANKRMLQEMPHENMEDLSAICYVDFPVESNDGKATMKVKNEHLKMWNVDAKEMFRQARANTQPVNTPILQSMDEMLLSIFNEEGHATNLLDENVDFGLRSHDMLYALTNVEKQYGASMITQPEVLNKLEQLFPEGFYVLPSSVHEVLIVPDNGEMEPKMLGEMVREVNKNEVERQEVLSDRVYSYDKEKHQIRQEPDSIQQVKEMER